MSQSVSKTLKRLKPVARESEKSPIREMLKRMEDGADILSLAFGEANFDPPAELLAAATRALEGGRNLYTSTNGIPLIRQAIADFTRKWWHAGIDAEEQILMTVGGMEAIYLAAGVLLEKGDCFGGSGVDYVRHRYNIDLEASRGRVCGCRSPSDSCVGARTDRGFAAHASPSSGKRHALFPPTRSA